MALRSRHILAALAASLALPASASAGVVSFSGAERPLAQEWASWSCADASRVKQVESPAAQGARAYELEVRDGDYAFGERCEIGMGNPGKAGFPTSQEGDEEWISFQVYLPDDYPIETPMWNVFFQIHQKGDGGCPPIALHVERGQFKLFNSDRNTYVLSTHEKWAAPAQRNRWAKFTMHIKHSPDPAVGFVELYGDLDGQGEKLLMPLEHMHTMTKDAAGAAMVNHSRVGIYRNPAIAGTAHILFDGYTIATDRASAEVGAFGEGYSTATPPAPAQPPAPPAPAATPPATAGANPSRPARTRRARRVVLRARHRRGRKAAHSSGNWPRIVPVYGWVKTEGPVGRRSVVIEIRRHGRWERLSRGWLRENGRFYLTPAVEPGPPRTVKLRAHVAGLGYSKPLTARV